ncbi:MAG: hypothetical protein ACREM8_03095 [Vulcanimicrobiaceae bacterium]
MHKRLALFAAVLAATVAFGSVAVRAQVAPGDSGAGFKRGVEAQNNSGQVGEVTLFARGAKTLVVLTIQGEPAGHVEPAHVHRGHDCQTLNPKPQYPLHPVVNGRSTTVVPVEASRLLSGNYVVNVHQSVKNISHYVACGPLTPGT